MKGERLSDGDLLQLKRLSTPTVYNGWEQITACDTSKDGFNLEPVQDFTPHMGPMVGYAVTVVCEASSSEHPRNNPDGWAEYRRYVASVPGPKIVVVQDLDKPRMVGAWWGECNASMHKALGCVGSVCDGAVRDVDEVVELGFKLLARGTGVGHAHSWPVRWGGDVDVFGRTVRPGQLIHADRHGFLAIPTEDEPALLEAAYFMDAAECNTFISAARDTAGKTPEDILRSLDNATEAFRALVRDKYGKKGE